MIGDVGRGEVSNVACVGGVAKRRCCKQAAIRFLWYPVNRFWVVVNRVALRAFVADAAHTDTALQFIRHVCPAHRSRGVHQQHDVGFDQCRAHAGHGGVGYVGQGCLSSGQQACKEQTENEANREPDSTRKACGVFHFFLSTQRLVHDDLDVAHRLAWANNLRRDLVIGQKTGVDGGRIGAFVHRLFGARARAELTWRI